VYILNQNLLKIALLPNDCWRLPFGSTWFRKSNVKAGLIQWSGRHQLLPSDRCQLSLCCSLIRIMMVWSLHGFLKEVLAPLKVLKILVLRPKYKQCVYMQLMSRRLI